MHGLIFETSVCYWQNQPGCYLCSHLTTEMVKWNYDKDPDEGVLGIDFKMLLCDSQLLIFINNLDQMRREAYRLTFTQLYHLVPSMRFWFPRNWRGCSCSKVAFPEERHIWKTPTMLYKLRRIGKYNQFLLFRTSSKCEHDLQFR